jgi:hypothetical protein
MDHQPIETKEEVPEPTIGEHVSEVLKPTAVKLTSEPITIPDMPKSINVDWDEVDKDRKATSELIKKIVPNPDEEEIMEF